MCQQTECGVGDMRRLFDVRVFNLHAPSNKNQIPACYRNPGKEKNEPTNRGYVRCSTRQFTPLVLLAIGVMGREAICFYKCLASMLAQDGIIHTVA